MEEFLRFCTQLFDKIPATFWGVVVGSLFTLTGIYFTNRASDSRLKKQLQNDRELKNRDREMNFRKEIYAAATEAISASVSALSKFSDLSISQGEIAAICVEKSSVIAKANLVAGEDAIYALSDFGREFAGAFLRLTQQRMVLSVLQKEIAAKMALVEGFEKTRDAMIELMRHHNIEGIQDTRRFEALQGNYDFEAGRIATTKQEIHQLHAQLAVRHIPLQRECFVENTRVNRLLIPLLAQPAWS